MSSPASTPSRRGSRRRATPAQTRKSPPRVGSSARPPPASLCSALRPFPATSAWPWPRARGAVCSGPAGSRGQRFYARFLPFGSFSHAGRLPMPFSLFLLLGPCRCRKELDFPGAAHAREDRPRELTATLSVLYVTSSERGCQVAPVAETQGRGLDLHGGAAAPAHVARSRPAEPGRSPGRAVLQPAAHAGVRWVPGPQPSRG